MKVITDFHIHSRYAMATSKDLAIKNLEKYSKIKGVHLLGTGDFTHPKWLEELKSELIEDGSGIPKTKNGFPFVLSAELSNIYSEGGKVRKVHNIILAKNFDVVDQINLLLSKKGKIESDGRPIFGKYPCYTLVEDLKKIDKDIEIIPAHIWTPWFSLFGANSGFDNLEDCFLDQTKHIHALETGLSSDPKMNWRISQLDKYTLVSNSDLHSFWPWRLGREANVIEMKNITYDNLINAIRTRNNFIETIEVDPNFGKYHFTGHRNCNVVLAPREAKKLNNICPVCKKQLTVGVLERVEELADRQDGYVPKGAVPFRSMIPLSELISGIIGSPIASKKVWQEYYKLVNLKQDRNEYSVLMYTEKEELLKLVSSDLTDAILANRDGKIEISPGYDGLYGVPKIGSKILAIDSDDNINSKFTDKIKIDKNQEEKAKEFFDRKKEQKIKDDKIANKILQKGLKEFI